MLLFLVYRPTVSFSLSLGSTRKGKTNETCSSRTEEKKRIGNPVWCGTLTFALQGWGRDFSVRSAKNTRDKQEKFGGGGEHTVVYILSCTYYTYTYPYTVSMKDPIYI